MDSAVKRNTSNSQASSINKQTEEAFESKEAPFQIVWFNVILQILIHIGALYGVYCCFYAKPQTLIAGDLLIFIILIIIINDRIII